MNITKINEHLRAAEAAIVALAGDAIADRPDAWKAAVMAIKAAEADANTGNVRSDEQMATRRIVVAYCEQLERALMEVDI